MVVRTEKSDDLACCVHWSADCKRGRRKGATSKNVKNRQKESKSFSTLFDNFRAGQKTSKIVRKCQKVFRHFSTIFARHLFSGPFCNPLNWDFPFLGIMPGLYGMENGQKPEMGKKNGKPNGKEASAGRGQKMAQNWEFRGSFPFSSIFERFLAILAPVHPAGGRFPLVFHVFPHFRLLASFHAITARHDPNPFPASL